MQEYDVAVIGLGGMGSQALWRLAKRGCKVIGIEQFHRVHAFGSSHGATRIIRKAYFEHPDYVPLLEASYRLWDELEGDAKASLFARCGLLLLGDEANSTIIGGVRRAVTEHDLAVDWLSRQEVQARYSQFAVPDGYHGVLETDAGMLYVERCVEAALDQAKALGAELVDETGPVKIHNDKLTITIKFSDQEIHTKKLVVAAGAWTNQILAPLGTQLPLQAHRNLLFWHPSPAECSLAQGMPCFGFDTGESFFYGFPAIDSRGVKVAMHEPGQPIANLYDVDRQIHSGESAATDALVARYLPQLTGPASEGAACIYSMTPDEHFIIDQCKDDSRIVYGAGFSGHGFKFAPLVGEALAQLAVDGDTQLPISFLSAGRFGGSL